MKYLKINTLWKRDPANRNRIIEGDMSMSEFENIRMWHITEKIDGTNIRISFKDGKVRFDGKTDEAQISAKLVDVLRETFTPEKFIQTFTVTKTDQMTQQQVTTFPEQIILYGEGYGKPINGNKKYRGDAGIILFDVYVDGYWLEPANVEDIAKKMGVQSVPFIGVMTVDEAVAYLKTRPMSEVSNEPQVIEGIVARSYPMVLTRKDKEPVMWKLKVKDYTALEKP